MLDISLVSTYSWSSTSQTSSESVREVRRSCCASCKLCHGEAKHRRMPIQDGWKMVIMKTCHSFWMKTWPSMWQCVINIDISTAQIKPTMHLSRYKHEQVECHLKVCTNKTNKDCQVNQNSTWIFDGRVRHVSRFGIACTTIHQY